MTVAQAVNHISSSQSEPVSQSTNIPYAHTRQNRELKDDFDRGIQIGQAAPGNDQNPTKTRSRGSRTALNSDRSTVALPAYDDPAQRKPPGTRRRNRDSASSRPYPVPSESISSISRTSSTHNFPRMQTPTRPSIQVPELPLQPPYFQTPSLQPLQAAVKTPSMISAGTTEVAPERTATTSLQYWHEKSEGHALLMDMLVALTTAYNWQYGSVAIVGSLRAGVSGDVDIVDAQVHVRASFFLEEVKSMFRRAHSTFTINDSGMFLTFIYRFSFRCDY